MAWMQGKMVLGGRKDFFRRKERFFRRIYTYIYIYIYIYIYTYTEAN